MEPQPSARATAASSSSGSIAPVLTVPAEPTSSVGSAPSARSAAIDARSAEASRRPAASGTSRIAALPTPRSSSARRTQLWASAGTYAVSRGAPASPSRRTSCPTAASARVRAPARQTIVAADPPLVSRPPPGPWGKPTSSASQRTTVCSRWTSAWSPATTLGFIAAAASEATIPAGEGGGLTQPKNAGWPLPMACGRTSRSAAAVSSSSVAACSGRGASSSRSRTASGSGCQTGPDGSAAR